MNVQSPLAISLLLPLLPSVRKLRVWIREPVNRGNGNMASEPMNVPSPLAIPLCFLCYLLFKNSVFGPWDREPVIRANGILANNP
jgi:hypothetical protein